MKMILLILGLCLGAIGLSLFQEAQLNTAAPSPGQGGPAQGQSQLVPVQDEPAKVSVFELETPLEAKAEALLARAEAAEMKAQAYANIFDNLDAMRVQVRQLECKAALEPDGQIGLWAAQMDVVPDEKTLFRMAQLLHDYPIELQPEDGLWLVERIRQNDWYLFAPTVNEAIVAYFGDRITPP